MKIENIPLNITKNKLVQILLIGFVFFIPISTALMNLFLYSSLLLIVVNKDLGHDNLSMFKNLLKYRHESKKQVCNSFTYFRGQI